MENIRDKLQETCRYIQSRIPLSAEVAVILGSGLGDFLSQITDPVPLEYTAIPHFPRTTVASHRGQLVAGWCAGKPVLVMAGRFHYYEGYSLEEVVYPIRVLSLLGVKTLLVSNAAGGMNQDFRMGDLMILTDHINLGENPLRGPNLEGIGPRFPDLSEPYSKTLIRTALGIGKELGLDLKTGVYAGVQGPSFETRAEYRYLHLIGADAVGMSTVPEVIAAAHAGMQVFALSVITNLGIRDEENQVTQQEVLEAAVKAEPKLTVIFKKLIASL
ncbi:MAG TPA: purine-nucleoside phosphorylase [Chitinophagaceae bacterium]|nr:purine-nucleoside phosphorylase [Chitinophagaceae bacterium]